MNSINYRDSESCTIMSLSFAELRTPHKRSFHYAYIL